MDTPFFCSDCRSEHTEPATANLGHVVLCLDCALNHEVLGGRFDVDVAGPMVTTALASVAA